jgi:xylan 1,4-beta-xylosidase
MKTTLTIALAFTAAIAAGGAETFPVTIEVDAAQPTGPLRRFWRYFGADEPNYATMKDGQKLLGQIGELAPREMYFRAHNLLNTGDGTPALKWGSTNAYTEDAAGNPVYDFRGIDRIFESYLDRGVRPLVQIGFMPEAMSTAPQPYRHSWRPGLPYNKIYTGWTKPPKDYAKWGELAYQWAKHSVEKYGADEVNTWWWEVWNEANNQPNGYWGGSIEEFLKLHDYAIAGVRRALPTARVGGPHTAGHGGQFMIDFLDHALRGTNFATGEKGTPLDFVAFHAKGSPTVVDGHVRMGISNQLRTIETAFATFASYPELQGVPVIIGESDPEGCAACQGAQLAYRNGTVYSSYTAAVFARKHDLADRYGTNLEGAGARRAVRSGPCPQAGGRRVRHACRSRRCRWRISGR